MVMHFSYEKSREEALKEMKIFLMNEEFTILEFAPEDGFILTDYKSFDWGQGKRLLAVSVHIHDKMTINGMGKMDIPVSGIGENDELLKIKTFDRLPYKIQRRTLFTLIDPLDSLGYKQLNHWP
jgi:hypothetical protein|tara:strand:- start:3810 stop:4181 length:372 start_codon:yes stop_codon:yes gene_type:complete